MILVELNNQEMELKYDYNSICAMEEKMGKGINAIMQEDSAGLNMIRVLLWAGLRHAYPTLKIDTVGTWIFEEIKKGSNKLEIISKKCMEALVQSGILGDKTVNQGE